MSSMMNPTNSIKVFSCYAHQDESLFAELEKQLNILRRNGYISSWDYRMINAGDDWKPEADEHLNKAQIILLLISTEFMESDYCYDIIMKRALERHEAGNAHVIPIILRPCLWEEAAFSKLSILPRNEKPVTLWIDREEAFENIARDILKLVKKCLSINSGQQTEEVIKLIVRKHPLFLLFSSLPFMVSALAFSLTLWRASVLSSLGSLFLLPLNIALIILTIATAVGFINNNLIVWLFKRYIITNKRVIIRSIFSHAHQQIELAKITQVGFDIDTPLGLLLSYGAVHIYHAGGELILKDISQPGRVKEIIKSLL